jgi:hypothetical protein
MTNHELARMRAKIRGNPRASSRVSSLGKCPLYPRKRTSPERIGMSVKAHNATYAVQQKDSYSITSSASAKKFAGSSMPVTFAETTT